MGIPEKAPSIISRDIVDDVSKREKSDYYDTVVEASRVQSVKRSSSKEGHLHLIFIGASWLAFGCITVIVVVWFIHQLGRDSWYWLDKNRLNTLDSLLLYIVIFALGNSSDYIRRVVLNLINKPD